MEGIWATSVCVWFYYFYYFHYFQSIIRTDLILLLINFLKIKFSPKF